MDRLSCPNSDPLRRPCRRQYAAAQIHPNADTPTSHSAGSFLTSTFFGGGSGSHRRYARVGTRSR